MFSTLIWFFYWLITCSRKPKVPGLSPNRPANVQVSVKRVEVVERSQRSILPLPLLSFESRMFVN